MPYSDQAVRDFTKQTIENVKTRGNVLILYHELVSQRTRTRRRRATHTCDAFGSFDLCVHDAVFGGETLRPVAHFMLGFKDDKNESSSMGMVALGTCSLIVSWGMCRVAHALSTSSFF